MSCRWTTSQHKTNAGESRLLLVRVVALCGALSDAQRRRLVVPARGRPGWSRATATAFGGQRLHPSAGRRTGAPGELVSPSRVPTVPRPLLKRQGMVDAGRVELPLSGCRPEVLPLSLRAQETGMGQAELSSARAGHTADTSRLSLRACHPTEPWRTHAESNRADRGCNSAPSRLALRPNWRETARARTYVWRPYGARRLPENCWCGQPDSNRCLDLGKVES
jgi:hypothetical protein